MFWVCQLGISRRKGDEGWKREGHWDAEEVAYIVSYVVACVLGRVTENTEAVDRVRAVLTLTPLSVVVGVDVEVGKGEWDEGC